MKTYYAVTGILQHNSKTLILKKSHDDFNYPDKWSFCSGYVKEFEAAEDTIVREIKEETGLDGKIVKKGRIFQVVDSGKTWVVTPFLCKVDSDNVKLCHENTEYKWINLEDIGNYESVPGIKKALKTFGLA